MKSYSEKAKRFYHSKLWKRVRDRYMKEKHYLCERCGGYAKIVHHKSYINDSNLNDLNILIDFSNLEALCLDCHNKEHFKKERTRKEFEFDNEGNFILKK